MPKAASPLPAAAHPDSDDVPPAGGPEPTGALRQPAPVADDQAEPDRVVMSDGTVVAAPAGPGVEILTVAAVPTASMT